MRVCPICGTPLEPGPRGPECPEGCDEKRPAGCPFCGFDGLPWCPDHEDPLG